MNRLRVLVAPALVALAVFPLLQAGPSWSATPGNTVHAVTTGNVLLRFDESAPGVIQAQSTITGLQMSESVLGIDFRPATGQLYGIGSTSRVYTINPATGVATEVGSGPFTPALSGSEFGVDFNPTVDRIRVVSNAGQNLRLHPDTGAVVATDMALNYAMGDPNFGAVPNVVGAAYTNNFAGATTTTLFDIDSALDILATQNPPNNGTLNTVGSLNFNASALVGLDIVTSGGMDRALASMIFPTTSRRTSIPPAVRLYSVDLANGSATPIGKIGGPTTVRDIAIQPPATETMYATTASGKLLRFNRSAPGTIEASVTITGLQMGESVLGIDFRPATGQLYGIGSTSRVYTINPATGVATEVGSGPFTPVLLGSEFGVDFNPTVDRIRVVSDTGQNLRLHPDTGAVVATDMALNYAMGDPNFGAVPNVVGAAYTNNFAGATTTTLFDIDSALDILATQNPPNNGTLNTVGSLGVDATDFVGLDVFTDGAGDRAFAAINSPAQMISRLYA
ncbi:MAG TPA: DUF4394 domain-containing protein, partial [Actinomycetota bacterium]|nr:DUF4394 domain-containing protein [Actinomycetota bacterium]